MRQMKFLHLPGLNGLRAIAALAVVISHITLALGTFGLNPFIFGTSSDGAPQGLNMAGFGVSIFFALSGFLITYLLLLEKEKADISIRKFYIRRILRIWPLYYLYLVICIAVAVYMGMKLQTGSIALYTFYAANVPFIIGGLLPFVAHYWSLGVEEQFYLFWPWIVKKTNKKLLFIVCALIFILITLKLFFRFYFPGGDNSLPYMIIHVTRFHCMMIGAVGAIIYYSGNQLFLRVLTNKLTQLFAWSIIILIAINKFHIASVLDNEFVSVVAVILIVSQINVQNRLINLEHNVFDFLGKISYGMYVIHPLIIFGAAKLIGELKMNDLAKYALVYSSITAFTIIISNISYEHFEKWFLQLKHKYSVIKTSASKDYQAHSLEVITLKSGANKNAKSA